MNFDPGSATLNKVKKLSFHRWMAGSILVLPLTQNYTPQPHLPLQSQFMSVKMDVLHGHSDIVNCVTLRSNGHVVSSEDGTIIAHSTKTGIVEYRADNVFANAMVSLVFAIFRMVRDLWL